VCNAECYKFSAAEHALKVVQSNPEVKVADTSLILGESEIIYKDKFMDIMGDFEVEAAEKLEKLEQSYADLQKLRKDTCKKFGSKDSTKWIEFAAYITDFMEEWKKCRQAIAKMEAALAKEAKDKARKEGKKKGKKKLKDLMKKRGKKEDLQKKGVIKNVDDVRKANKTKTDTEMLLSNHLAVLNKQTRLQEKRKRTASFFMPSRTGTYGRDRGRIHTYQSDLREELNKASRRSLTSLGTAPMAVGVEQEVGVTRARRTIGVPTSSRRRRQTTNHLEDPNSDLSREDWIAKLLGKPMPSKDAELPDVGMVPQHGKRKNKKKKKKKNRNQKVRTRPNNFDQDGGESRAKKRGRQTVFVDPSKPVGGGDVDAPPDQPIFEKQLSLVLTGSNGGSRLIGGSPDAIGDEMVVDHSFGPSPSKKKKSVGAMMSARIQTKKSRAELESDLARIHKVTSVKMRNNKKRHITVKDGRLWWLKNETMATQVVNGDLSDASPKHSLELRFVKSIETGVAGNVFTTKAQNGDDSLNPDVCVSIASEDRDLNIMMEEGKIERDKWVRSLRQLVKLIQES